MLPKRQILAFLAAGLDWPANDMPHLADFRFARLGPKHVCLVAAWSRRSASENEVICPAPAGGYWDTSLANYAPVPVAWAVADLDGDGVCEVISSQAEGTFLYWYQIYRFADGLPHDASAEFPGFYKAVLVRQLSVAREMLSPPFMSERLSPRARLAEDVTSYLQLRYQRTILGDRDAGLEQGIAWTKSDYIDVQGLGLATLGDIRDPRSIDALRELGRSTRNQGICVGVENALAGLEGRKPDLEKIQQCDSMTPEPARLLQ